MNKRTFLALFATVFLVFVATVPNVHAALINATSGINFFNGIINSSGWIGIGTTSAPLAPLYVFDDNYNTTNPGIRIGSNSSGGGYLDLGWDYSGNGRAWIAYTENLDTADFGIRMKGNAVTNEKFTILGSGNVGIGTTGPGQKLDINGSAIVSSTSWYYGYNTAGSAQPLVRSKGMGYNPTTYPGLQVGQAGDSIALFIDPGSVSGGNFNGIVENEIFLPSSTRFEQVNNGGTDWIDTMYFKSGSVGIGTTGPGYKLDVNGNANFVGQVNIPTPTATSSAATKGYVDTAVGAGGQWLTTSTGIFYNSGNVGIGTASPISWSKLDVNGVLSISGLGDAGTGLALISSEAGSRGLEIKARAGSNPDLVVASSGNVGIGTSSPAYVLDVSGNTRIGNGALLAGNTNEIWTQPQTNGSVALYINYRGYLGGTSQYRDLSVDNGEAGLIAYFQGSSASVGIGTSSPAYKLDVASAGATTARFGISASDTIVVGGGSGKVTAATVDPPYTINGEKYATYASGMVGQKEETTGVVEIKCPVPSSQCQTVLDFGNAPKGSDLWLFARATNLKTNIDRMTVLLTPSFDGRVWYEKDVTNDRLTIFGVPSSIINNPSSFQVSYRLAAPRFDAAKWPNTRTDEPAGLIIND